MKVLAFIAFILTALALIGASFYLAMHGQEDSSFGFGFIAALTLLAAFLTSCRR